MPVTTAVLRQRLLARSRLRHWLGFARVAELGSVRKAADSIGIAQPALTVLLSDLETLLDVALFDRHARGMRLTRIGRELLPVVRRLLNAIDDVAEQVFSLQAETQNVVRIGAIGGAISGLLAPMLPALSERYPRLMVQLLEADTHQLDQWIAREEIDVALSREPQSIPQGWRFIPLLEDRFVVVAAPHHPIFHTGPHPTLAQLRAAVWLAMPADSMARERFDSMFKDQLPTLCQISSRVPDALWSLLSTRQLLAMIPASVVRSRVDAGDLKVVPLQKSLNPGPIGPLGALIAIEEQRSSVESLLQVLQQIQPMQD
jgi:DNA-binding transcriptional LysR family regulator